MAAITTITNPLFKDKVLLFYSNENKTLSLEHRPFDAGQGRVMGSNKAGSTVPEILSPSSLVSFIYESCVSVYGITYETVDTKKVSKICLLSPIYEPVVNAVPTNGFLAGCIDTKAGKGWLYHHESVSGEVKIVQREISTKADGSEPLGITSFLADTKLSAVYDPVLNIKWLVYQKADKNIAFWNVNKEKDEKLDESSNHAREQTNIGACYAPGDDKRKARLYVYTVHPNGTLRRAWSEAGKSLDFPRQFTKVGESKISTTSQISVVADPTNSQNLIYVVQTGSTNISVITDSYVDEDAEK